MYDLREGKNVAIADINVGNLTQAITALASNFPAGTFNGVLYVYMADSSSDHPAAVRLDNGAQTPGYDSLQGFTVATNGGIYVRGDYNTVTNNNQLLMNPDGTENTSHGDVNPAALMADQITILSSGWDDKVVTPELSGITDPTMIANMHNPEYTSGTDSSYTGTPRVVPGNTHATIAAGLLTGNTTDNGAVYSGGGENLVRFLEDWNFGGNGDTVNFWGSFGQLFQSTVFNGQWHSPYETDSSGNSTNSAFIYNYPGSRFYSFNSSLKSKPPPCSPNTTLYSRGMVFTW
jgi:hypothetical protein